MTYDEFIAEHCTFRKTIEAKQRSDQQANVARKWIRDSTGAAYDPRKDWYRTLGKDLDKDIFDAAGKVFAATNDHKSAYELRRLRRILLRNFDVIRAARLESLLWRAEAGADHLWVVLRVRDLFLPRLAIGIFAGFLLVWSSSGLLDFSTFVDAQKPGWTGPLAVASLLICAFFAAAEIQQRVGRRGRTLLLRTLCLLAYTVLYVCIGGTIVEQGAASFTSGTYPMTRGRIIVICSLSAVLGFLFQLFWQDHSTGEPL